MSDRTPPQPHPVEQNLDRAFFACLGEQNPRDPNGLMGHYGPYETTSQSGEPTIVFGTKEAEKSPSNAYAIGVVGAAAVRAANGSEADGKLLHRWAHYGAVAVTLQSKTFHDALMNLRLGNGQTGALAIATNIIDPRSKPNLTHSLADLVTAGGHLVDPTKDGPIHYFNPTGVVQDSLAALKEYAARNLPAAAGQGDSDMLLAVSYGELIARGQDAGIQPQGAWLRGLVEAGNALTVKGIDLRSVFGAELLDTYQQARQSVSLTKPEIPKPAFDYLQLNKRPDSLAPKPQAGSGVATPPSEGMPGQPELSAEERQRLMRRIIEGGLANYRECVADVEEMRRGIEGGLLQRFPFLRKENLRAVIQNDKMYSSLIKADPGTVANALLALRGKRGLTADEAAVMLAAANAKRILAPRLPNVTGAATAYILRNHSLLTTVGALDLPDETLHAHTGYGRDALRKYLGKRYPSLEKSPSHLVLLAASIITDNANSVLPLTQGPYAPISPDDWFKRDRVRNRLPDHAGFNRKRFDKNVGRVNEEYKAWKEQAQRVDDVVSSLRVYLSNRYQCNVPVTPGFSKALHQLEVSPNFRFLAHCAQMQNGATSLPDDEQHMRALLRHVDPNSLGLARPLYDKLVAHYEGGKQPAALPAGPDWEALKVRGGKIIKNLKDQAAQVVDNPSVKAFADKAALRLPGARKAKDE